jgi:hypothetical protein
VSGLGDWKVKDVEMYQYELVLPGLVGHARLSVEKSLGPAQVGQRIVHPDVVDGVLTDPAVEWEVESIEESAPWDGRLVLRRPA